MATYTSYDLVEFGQPVQKRERELPVPKNSEVLVRVRRAGVCHSDLHIQSGEMNLGEEGVLSMAERGMKLPVALGHEILGEIVAIGPDADPPAAPIGKTMLVFPWVGCGACLACDELRENDCVAPHFMGLVQDGGYATHTLVRDPKFLVDVEGLDPDTVTPHACSGLTVYNALRKAGPVRDGEWLAVMGTGGLGLNAISIARALGHERIIAIDNRPEQLEAARKMGAHQLLDSSAPDALESLRAMSNNRLLAVVDTVGVPATSRLAVHALVKTGRYVCVGLHGGDFKMPLPWLPQKALTVCGCHVGSSLLLRELIDLVKTGKVQEIPVESRPLSAVGRTLEDLKAGRISGRVVLNAD